MIEENSFNTWLEETVKDLIEAQPDSAMVCMMLDDGDVYTAYYHCNATDKAIFAHNIELDKVMDFIRANKEEIAEMLGEEDEDDEYDGD